MKLKRYYNSVISNDGFLATADKVTYYYKCPSGDGYVSYTVELEEKEKVYWNEERKKQYFEELQTVLEKGSDRAFSVKVECDDCKDDYDFDKSFGEAVSNK